MKKLKDIIIDKISEKFSVFNEKLNTTELIFDTNYDDSRISSISKNWAYTKKNQVLSFKELSPKELTLIYLKLKKKLFFCHKQIEGLNRIKVYLKTPKELKDEKKNMNKNINENIWVSNLG